MYRMPILIATVGLLIGGCPGRSLPREFEDLDPLPLEQREQLPALDDQPVSNDPRPADAPAESDADDGTLLPGLAVELLGVDSSEFTPLPSLWEANSFEPPPSPAPGEDADLAPDPPSSEPPVFDAAPPGGFPTDSPSGAPDDTDGDTDDGESGDDDFGGDQPQPDGRRGNGPPGGENTTLFDLTGTETQFLAAHETGEGYGPFMIDAAKTIGVDFDDNDLPTAVTVPGFFGYTNDAHIAIGAVGTVHTVEPGTHPVVQGESSQVRVEVLQRAVTSQATTVRLEVEVSFVGAFNGMATGEYELRIDSEVGASLLLDYDGTLLAGPSRNPVLDVIQTFDMTEAR